MAYSGQITVTTAGTAVRGPSEPSANLFAIKAHPDNLDAIWIGNVDGDVSSANGFPLDPGEGLTVQGTLSLLWFDADSDGDKICWVVLVR